MGKKFLVLNHLAKHCRLGATQTAKFHTEAKGNIQTVCLCEITHVWNPLPGGISLHFAFLCHWSRTSGAESAGGIFEAVSPFFRSKKYLEAKKQLDELLKIAPDSHQAMCLKKVCTRSHDWASSQLLALRSYHSPPALLDKATSFLLSGFEVHS